MHDGVNRTVEIDIKDLLCFVFKRMPTIILVSVVFALAGIGYSYFKQTRFGSASASGVLDISVKLAGESDEAYSNRVANVERANDIMNNISELTNQIEIQNEYLSNSVYMQIDPLNTAYTKMQVIITCDNSVVGGLETLCNTYSFDITRGAYVDTVASDLGYTPGAVEELISCYLTLSESEYSDSQMQMGVINITVIGKNLEDTDYIMDAIATELNSKQEDYNLSIVPHTMSIIGRQSSVGYDSSVRKAQLDSVTTLNNIQSQINNLNNNLDNVAKTLGLEDRTSFYERIDTAAAFGANISVKDCIKFGVLGLALGMMLVIGLFVLIYIFGRKIVSQTQFFALFDIVKIGVCKPSGKRNKLQVVIDQYSSDDSIQSKENTNAIVAANLKNLTADMKKVLFTSTIDADFVRDAIKELEITGDIKLDMFSNPSILENVTEYDGVVIVEQRGVSRKKAVGEQLRLLSNSGTKIVGAVIV